MAERSLPSWKQVFDSVERRVGPRINELARSEEVAALAALNKRSQTELSRRLEQVSRRALHVMNLPAGSDMNRLLTHIAHLEREVRDLRKQVTDRNDAEFLASLSARRSQNESMSPQGANAEHNAEPKSATPSGPTALASTSARKAGRSASPSKVGSTARSNSARSKSTGSKSAGSKSAGSKSAKVPSTKRPSVNSVTTASARASRPTKRS